MVAPHPDAALSPKEYMLSSAKTAKLRKRLQAWWKTVPGASRPTLSIPCADGLTKLKLGLPECAPTAPIAAPMAAPMTAPRRPPRRRPWLPLASTAHMAALPLPPRH